jgi:hypothetical protein
VVALSFFFWRARVLGEVYFEPWPHEPELRQFLDNKIGLGVNARFRGSAFFYTLGLDEFLTLDSLWADGVPTTNEYGQLVTPQAIYFIHQLFNRDLSSDLNWFRPWINTGGAAFPVLFRTFRALGVRYVGGYEQFEVAGMEGFRSASFPRRPPGNPPGLWVLYEIPDVNVGDYSPTEVTTARSAAEIVAALGAANFDFTRQAVLSAEVRDPLVPARDMKLSVIRGGLHVSGHSDGTSLVVLPQQFSHCLRARDGNVRLVRANLIMTGVIFSDDVDTDIVLDYGIFTPGCRWSDLADIKKLKMQIDVVRCRCRAASLLTGRKQFRSSVPLLWPCNSPPVHRCWWQVPARGVSRGSGRSLCARIGDKKKGIASSSVALPLPEGQEKHGSGQWVTHMLCWSWAMPYLVLAECRRRCAAVGLRGLPRPILLGYLSLL